METHEYTRNFDMPGLPGNVSKNSGKAIPKFSETVEIDEGASAAAGRPVVRPLIRCEIFIPGDQLNTATKIVNPENPEDPTILRFPQEWARFAATLHNEDDPTKWRLDNWVYLNPATVEMLKRSHIYYVEDLAELTDQQLSDAVGIGGNKLRKQAKAAVEAARNGGKVSKLVTENETLADRIKEQEKTIEALSHKIEGLIRAQAAAPAEQILSIGNMVEAAATPAPKGPVIPDNYTDLSFGELKKIASSVAPAIPVKSKADAIELIEEHLAG